MQNTTSEVRNATLIGTSCFLGYAGCYLGRNILSSMLPQMLELQIYSRQELGQMGSMFLVTYGVGQLVNGLIGDLVSAKYMISTGLMIAGILCLVFPISTSSLVSLMVWALCGFVCSMLWGPISKLVGENTTAHLGRLTLTFMMVASIVGSGSAYVMALVSSTAANWKIGYFITGYLLVIIAFTCFFMIHRMERKGIVKQVQQNSRLSEKTTLKPYLANNAFFYMCIVAILNGIIRNAVVFWIPTFITEHYLLSVPTAISISAVLPLINLCGTLCSVLVVKRLQYNEKKTLFVLFTGAFLMFLLMYLVDTNMVFMSIGILFFASAAMTGACNMIFSYYVLGFTNTGKVSSLAGFLDFVSYLFASIANSIFSITISTTGWKNIVLSWIVITLLGSVFSWIVTHKCIYPEVQK